MSGTTHAVIGANAVWLSLLVATSNEMALVFLAVGAFAGLLPDIDAQAAKIHFLGGGALGMFRGGFKHRAFFHSLLCVGILFAIATIFLSTYHPLLPAVLALGYASHPLIDGLNYGGVQYLFPSQKKYHLVPKWLATPVGGFMDQLLFVLGILSLALFVLTTFTSFSGVL